MNFMNFSGKKVMVVGASSGIGQATATLLAELGARVVFVSRNSDKLYSIVKSLEHPDRHLVIPYDVTDFDKCKSVFEEAVADGQKLDSLVYCAGVAKVVPLRVITRNEYDNIFATNFYGFLNMVQCYAKRKYNNGGSIVVVSALNVHYPQKCMTIYSASKAAIESTVRTLSIELADMNIRINSVIPGAVMTSMAETVDRETLEQIVSKQLLGAQQPEEVANMIAFLSSDKSSAITGRNVYVDGGMLGQ